jgi:hypothetical protein
VIETDIQELYALIRGARFANSLQDAATAAGQGDYSAAQKLVGDVRDHYEKIHLRTLKKDLDQVEAEATKEEAKRLANKQEKYRRALAKFDEVLTVLNRRPVAQPSVKSSGNPPARAAGKSPAAPLIPADLVLAFEVADSRDAKFQVIRKHFEVREVAVDHTIQDNTCYFLRDNDRDYLLRVAPKEPSSEEVSLEDAVSGEHLVSLSKSTFLNLGKRRRLVQLSPKAPKPVTADSNPPEAEQAGAEEDASPSNPPNNSARDAVLDKGAFTQLMDAAQRCKLVPGADQIGHVRDREFRLGKYQKASRAIEGMFNKFTSAASQRAQRLRREEMDIASGKVKMAPRDLQAKRARDVAETQLVERARNRFMRVLEGLRILMRT